MSVPILMYHSISLPTCLRQRIKSLSVPPESFAAQMDYLSENDYTLLNIGQLIDSFTGKARLPERPVVLTFDDGYADFYQNALPILARHNFTATLYVATGLVGKTASWDGASILNWDQIKEISKRGIECGAHTHSHPKLDALPLAVARKEIFSSKYLLEHHLEQEITSFAYPYGFYTADVRHLVQELGFTSACAVNHAMCSDTSDHFTLERLMVTTSMNIPAFQALLDGHSPLKKASIQSRVFVKRTIRRCIASISRLMG